MNALQALLFLEEMASIVVTPFVLYFSLPQCAPAILAFLRDFTVRVDGVGDICSMAGFDFERHGNAKYGSPSQAPKVRSLFQPLSASPIYFIALSSHNTLKLSSCLGRHAARAVSRLRGISETRWLAKSQMLTVGLDLSVAWL